MRPSQRNKLDRKLLADAIAKLESSSRETDEHAVEAFRDMLVGLEAMKKETLTDKQRTWAESMAGVETYENAWSAGKVPPGKPVPTPAILRRENLPMKPPGRK